MTGCRNLPALIAARSLCGSLTADNDRLRAALTGLVEAVEAGGDLTGVLDRARMVLAVDAVTTGG